ncbi:hypothetical protein OBBRIDRAFT_798757 [Obba rivulosa]|uniref:Uncharacterized protein n=1 Tax=Obba rivulosa TaxID=1052685 RepID=A0A8E2DFH2_9APHY|nr:hypothetical protein OBBRIDRAFT_798757 [Obba rivulosa]
MMSRYRLLLCLPLLLSYISATIATPGSSVDTGGDSTITPAPDDVLPPSISATPTVGSEFGEAPTTLVMTTVNVLTIHLPSSSTLASSTSSASPLPAPAALHSVSSSPAVPTPFVKHHTSFVTDMATATSSPLPLQAALAETSTSPTSSQVRTVPTVESSASQVPLQEDPSTTAYSDMAPYTTLPPVSALTRTYDPSSAPTPTAIPIPDPDEGAEAATSKTSASERKTLLVASLLTLGILSALALFLLCLRYKVFTRIQHRRYEESFFDQSASAEEGLQTHGTQNEKHVAFNIPGPGEHVTLPSLSPGTHGTSVSPPPQILPTAYSPRGWRVFTDIHDGQYEDVTHILSPKAFGIGVSDPRPGSAQSHENEEEGGRTSRTSGGGASLSAESYTTCESRYSSPSAPRESQEAPLDSLAMSLSDRAPTESPPASPFVSTPDMSTRDFAAPPAGAKGQSRVLLNNLALMSAASQDLGLSSVWENELAEAVERDASGTMEKPVTVELGDKTCVLMHAM